MFLRLLFVLLMALNIAVGAWLVLGQPYAHGVSPTDPGVTKLRLLSEMPGHAAATAGRSAATPAASVASRCISLGPFATPQDLRDARQALSSQVTRTRSRQEQTRQSSSWWVYLPAAASREKALEQARQLGEKDVGDYFVVSVGDQPNAISLGLFKDPANAHKRRDEVVAAGFPAKIDERSESVPEYWLDLVLANGSRFDWRQRVAANVGAHSTRCF